MWLSLKNSKCHHLQSKPQELTELLHIFFSSLQTAVKKVKTEFCFLIQSGLFPSARLLVNSDISLLLTPTRGVKSMKSSCRLQLLLLLLLMQSWNPCLCSSKLPMNNDFRNVRISPIHFYTAEEFQEIWACIKYSTFLKS